MHRLQRACILRQRGPKGKKGAALQEAKAAKARLELGAGIVMVGMIGFVALIAVKTIRRDGGAVSESAALLDAARSDDALATASEAAAMQA